jgi:predicted Zn-dependent protease
LPELNNQEDFQAMNGQTAQNRHFSLKSTPNGVHAIMAAQNTASAQQQARGVVERSRQTVKGNVWIEESTIEDIMQVMSKGGYVPVLS